MMTEKIKSEVISRRRVFSLLGLAIASGLAVPATLMTATDAEARVGQPLSPVSVAGAARRADRRYKKKKMKASPEKTEQPK
jgi:membrane glycosyltransferase